MLGSKLTKTELVFVHKVFLNIYTLHKIKAYTQGNSWGGGQGKEERHLNKEGVKGADPPPSPNSGYSLWLALHNHGSSVSMVQHLWIQPLFSIFKNCAYK